MDIIPVALAAAGLLEGVLALYLYRVVKSLEAIIYPVYANLIWMREGNASLVEALTSILTARGVLSLEEGRQLRTMLQAGGVTDGDLDKVERMLDKRPEELSDEELKELKRIALSMLTLPSNRAIRLAVRLLLYASQAERRRGALRSAERVEMSYIAETCTIKISMHREGAVEVVEEPDPECVAEKASRLRELARRRDVEGADKALQTYSLCKERADAGCRALMSALGALERKSLDLMLRRDGA